MRSQYTTARFAEPLKRPMRVLSCPVQEIRRREQVPRKLVPTAARPGESSARLEPISERPSGTAVRSFGASTRSIPAFARPCDSRKRTEDACFVNPMSPLDRASPDSSRAETKPARAEYPLDRARTGTGASGIGSDREKTASRRASAATDDPICVITCPGPSAARPCAANGGSGATAVRPEDPEKEKTPALTRGLDACSRSDGRVWLYLGLIDGLWLRFIRVGMVGRRDVAGQPLHNRASSLPRLKRRWANDSRDTGI